ncbi:unnamed protein product, partial [Rhizoctonia solani]
MRLLSLPESLARSKAQLKKWMSIDSKNTTLSIAPVVQDMWPSFKSLMGQLESSAEVFGPLKSAIGELVRLAEACGLVYQEQNEYREVNLNLSILEGIDKQILEQKLTRMSPSMAATYNSAESIEIKRGGCTPGTRKPQIDLLLEWAQTSDSGKTCWMNGMAGTGKTT